MKKFLTFFAACAVFVVGCGDSGGGGTEATTTGSTTGSTAQKSAPAGGGTKEQGEVPEGFKTTGGEQGFAAVQAVFKTSCVGCHGENSPKEGVNLTSHEAVMKGGEHGPIVKPGDPENSVLVQVMRASHGKKQMPPAGALTDDKIKTIEEWIKAGAKA